VASRDDLLERFVVDESNADELRGQDFNVTPTKDNPVVIARLPDDTDGDVEPVRELRSFRWGSCRSGRRTSRSGRRFSALVKSRESRAACECPTTSAPECWIESSLVSNGDPP
jgi:hypothetical protein